MRCLATSARRPARRRFRFATNAKVPFFGAFTGAELLRTPFNRYVFNVRASYFDETELIVKTTGCRGLTRIVCSIRTTPTVRPDYWRREGACIAANECSPRQPLSATATM